MFDDPSASNKLKPPPPSLRFRVPLEQISRPSVSKNFDKGIQRISSVTLKWSCSRSVPDRNRIGGERIVSGSSKTAFGKWLERLACPTTGGGWLLWRDGQFLAAFSTEKLLCLRCSSASVHSLLCKRSSRSKVARTRWKVCLEAATDRRRFNRTAFPYNTPYIEFSTSYHSTTPPPSLSTFLPPVSVVFSHILSLFVDRGLCFVVSSGKFDIGCGGRFEY